MAVMVLAGCAGSMPDSDQSYLPYFATRNLPAPEPGDFIHCRGYGCAHRDRVTLTTKEWNSITASLKQSKTAAQERKTLSGIIAALERNVGEKTGTAGDIAGTFDKVGTHQLDCVDESINTTTYLAMMEQAGLLKFHKVSGPTARSPFTGMAGGRFWPHQTAVIFDTKTGDGYAVDSWYRDNGEPADIAPLSDWVYGWGPDQGPAENAE